MSDRQRILLISGKKGSGKTSTANFVAGLMLQKAGVVERFETDDRGHLVVNTVSEFGDGEYKSGEGVLDLKSTHPDVVQYLLNRIWPEVRIYSLADPIKSLLISMFDIPPENLYGNNEQKNNLLDYKLSDFGYWIAPRHTKEYKEQGLWDKKCTARQVMEIVGEHFRRLQIDIWSRLCKKNISAYPNKLAIVDDVRRPDEIKSFSNKQVYDVKSIRLTRRVDFSASVPETALDGWKRNKFNGWIDNKDMTQKEKNLAVIELLKEWKWV